MSMLGYEDPSFVFAVFRTFMDLYWLAACLCHSAVAAIIFTSTY